MNNKGQSDAVDALELLQQVPSTPIAGATVIPLLTLTSRYAEAKVHFSAFWKWKL